MNSNSRCSLQYHKKKIETIFVLIGPLYILFGKKVNSLKTIKLLKGHSITLKKEKFIECLLNQKNQFILKRAHPI